MGERGVGARRRRAPTSRPPLAYGLHPRSSQGAAWRPLDLEKPVENLKKTVTDVLGSSDETLDSGDVSSPEYDRQNLPDFDVRAAMAEGPADVDPLGSNPAYSAGAPIPHESAGSTAEHLTVRDEDV